MACLVYVQIWHCVGPMPRYMWEISNVIIEYLCMFVKTIPIKTLKKASLKFEGPLKSFAHMVMVM